MAPRSTALVALIGAVTLAAPSISHGELARETIALVSMPGSQAPRAAADALAARLARQLAPLPVVPTDRARNTLRQNAGGDPMSEAAERAAAARAALAAFDDLDQATQLLSEATAAYLELLPLLESLDELARLLMGLATVALARGDQPRLAEALQTAARLDPVLDLDPQEVSPRLARAAREARQAARELPVLTEARARRLGQRLGVDTVLLVQPRPDRRQVLVEQYRTTSGARVASWQVGLADAELTAIAEALLGAEPAAPPDDSAPDAGLAGDEPAAPAPAPLPQRRPWYRRWWVWTIIGAAVVGAGAAGIAVGVTAQDRPDNLTMEVRGHW